MHSKKIKQAFSVTLISALVVTSAMSAFAANTDGARKGKPDHVIEKQQEKQQELEVKREEMTEKQEKTFEKQNERKEKISTKREAVKEIYTEEELEALNENTENMKTKIKNGRVMPFDSIVSNRKNIKFDTPPVIKGERTLVPLRAISEGFKADVDWNEETREVTIRKGDMEIVIKIDSNIIFVNGEEVEIDAKAEIMSERTYVPLRFIAETLGIKVEWDQETETIELNEDLSVLKNELQEELEDLQKELDSLNNEYQEAQDNLSDEFTQKIAELEEKIKEVESNLQEVIEEIEQNTETDETQDTEVTEDEDTVEQDTEVAEDEDAVEQDTEVIEE